MHSKQTAMKKVPQQETEGALLLRIHEKGKEEGGGELFCTKVKGQCSQ